MQDTQDKDRFRHAEKCLYGYKRNVACLKVLREDLRVLEASTDVHAQNYQYQFTETNVPSNPIEARQIKMEALQARIRKLERCTNPITELMRDLTSPDVLNGSSNLALMEILKLMYFGGNTPDVIISTLNIARRTFFKRRRELVNIAITYLAF